MNHRLLRKLLTLCVLTAGLFFITSGDRSRAFADDETITYEQCMMLGGHRTMTIFTNQCICDDDWRSVCLEVGNTWDDYTCTCSVTPQLCNDFVRIRCYNGGGTLNEQDCKCEGSGQGFCYSTSYSECQGAGGTWDPVSCSCGYWYGGSPAVCNQGGEGACTVPGEHWDSVHCQCVR
jgi:hypothetical protein